MRRLGGLGVVVLVGLAVGSAVLSSCSNGTEVTAQRPPETTRLPDTTVPEAAADTVEQARASLRCAPGDSVRTAYVYTRPTQPAGSANTTTNDPNFQSAEAALDTYLSRSLPGITRSDMAVAAAQHSRREYVFSKGSDRRIIIFVENTGEEFTATDSVGCNQELVAAQNGQRP